jgi:hypothetical protein
VICCCSQEKSIDNGGKERDAWEEEAKYTVSKKPTANLMKRLSILEGI